MASLPLITLSRMVYTICAVCVVLIASNVGSLETRQSNIVEINPGLVQGSLLKSKYGRNFWAFLAIPYARPPIGAHRFTPPEPVDSWKGVFVANRTDVHCIQFRSPRQVDTEDCLVLNVYAPALSTNSQKTNLDISLESLFYSKSNLPACTAEKLPVVVVIHGGSFIWGSGSFDTIKPFKFMDYDVVMVTINYRLGVLGFLNTEDEESPGNYGMLDQVLALKWVRENIARFGGNPNKVTLVGNSAGGASVVYHILSPLSKGLFHAAIVQSGSPLGPWAHQSEPLEWAMDTAGLNNCSHRSTREIVDCLRKRSVDELFHSFQWATSHKKASKLAVGGPSIDVKYGRGFLIDHPIELLRQGKINKVPMIYGIAKDESYSFVLGLFEENLRIHPNQKFAEQLCHIVSATFSVAPSLTLMTQCGHVMNEYFGRVTVNDTRELLGGLVKVVSDICGIAGCSRTVELLANAGVSLQVYIFDYLLDNADDIKASYTKHGDDIILLFDQSYDNESIPDTVDNQRMAKMLNFIWTSFASNLQNTIVISPTDEPPLEWPLYTTARRQHLDLNLKPRVYSGPLSNKMDFWEKHIPIIRGF